MPLITGVIVTISLVILSYSFYEHENKLLKEFNKQEIREQQTTFSSFLKIWKYEVYQTVRTFIFSKNGESLRADSFNKNKWEENILEMSNLLKEKYGIERFIVLNSKSDVLSDYNPLKNKFDMNKIKEFSKLSFNHDQALYKFFGNSQTNFYLYSLLIDKDNEEDTRNVIIVLSENVFIERFSALYGNRSIIINDNNKIIDLDIVYENKHKYHLRKSYINNASYPKRLLLVSYVLYDSVAEILENTYSDIIYIIAIIIICCCLLSLVMTYRAFLPIKNIMKIINNLKQSNYQKEFVFSNKSEINIIGQELNNLIESVVESRKKEQEVVEINNKLIVDLKQKIIGLNLTAIMSETDISGDIIDCNEKFCEISKYSKDELIGQNHRILNSNYHDGSFWKECWKQISKGKVWKEEVCNKAKDGTFYWVVTSIFPVIKNGEITGYSSIRIDITAKRKLEEERIRATNSEKLASIGELSAGIGHEINNPLAINIGNIKKIKKLILEDNMDVLDIKKRLEVVSESNDRIRKIVDGLRIFSRGDNHKQEVVSIKLAIDQTLNLVFDIYKNEGIKIINKTPDIDLSTIGNLGKVQQILMNLISNAKDATENLDDRQIEISLEKKNDDQLMFRIKDNGMGIPDEIKDKILQPLFTTKKVGKGTGMGLGLVLEYIKEMKGDLVINSTLGQGSEFHVLLPLSENNLQEIDCAKDNTLEIKTNKKSNIQQKKIALVVDDEEDIREILISYLEDMGIDAHEADDGDSALLMVEKHKYDYICTDMKMKRIQGDEFIKKARVLPNGDTKYFIITGGVSTNLTPSECEELYNLADYYIEKPFDYDTIFDALHARKEKILV